MSTDNFRSLKKASFEAVAEIAPAPVDEKVLPVPESEIQTFKKFYGAATSALWDLFLTCDVEPERQIFFDRVVYDMKTSYSIAFCSGKFQYVEIGQEGDRGLGVLEDQFNEKDHNTIHGFFESLHTIIKERALEGIALRDTGALCIIEVSNPYCLLKLIQIFLEKHDILNLDDIEELSLTSKFKRISGDKISLLADKMRLAAAECSDNDICSVADDRNINISYFPPLSTPNFDVADIVLSRSQMTDNLVPFSLKLLTNTYRDASGKLPEPHCGLTLLH